MANYHAFKNKESGKWNISKEGKKSSIGSANTQKGAEKIAKGYAVKSGGSRVRIHGLNAKFVIAILLL